MNARKPRPVDELLSHARRTPDGHVAVVLAAPEAGLAAGSHEVRLRAGKRVTKVSGSVSEDGILSFAVPQEGLKRASWRILVADAGSDEQATRLQARLLAAPDQPVALLCGPEPKTHLAPPPPRPRQKRGPGGPGRPGGAGSAPAQGGSVLRKGARRGRALAAKVRRQLRERGDASGVRPVSPSGGTGRSTTRTGGPSVAPTPARRPAAPSAGTPGAKAGKATKPGKGKGGKGGKAKAGGKPPRLTARGDLRSPFALLADREVEQAVVLCTEATAHRTEAWLRALRPARVLVVLLTDDSDAAETWTRPEGRRIEAFTAPKLSALLRRVQALPRVDAVVTTFADEPDEWPTTFPIAGDVVARVFPYVRRGGAFVQDRAESTEDSPVPRWWAGLVDAPEQASRRETQDSVGEVARSVGGLVSTRDLVLATQRHQHFLKIREQDVTTLLRTREPDLDVEILATRPGGSLVPLTQETSYGPRKGAPWPDRVEYPEMVLRHYRGAIASGGGMLLTAGDSVLPESFRWAHQRQLDNSRVLSNVETARIQGRYRPGRGPEDTLPGTYFHVDCAYSGHFGHFATETLSRFWGWQAAKEAIPDLKAFFYIRPDYPDDGTLERTFLTAYGIAEDDIVSVERPVRLEAVVGASPMWHNTDPFYVHPDIREIWERLTPGLLTGPSSPHERIFVSRGAELNHRRGCRNAEEVEQLFADHGFHIFCPEDLPLQEQTALFANARVVAGYGGSAMANLMHCRRLESTIILSHHGYIARNEHLYLSLLGGDFHYFWSPSDVEPPESGRTLESFRSSWEFDFAGQGDDLRRVLADL